MQDSNKLIWKNLSYECYFYIRESDIIRSNLKGIKNHLFGENLK